MAYIGEIKLWAGTYAPSGWAFCAGQLLSIAENSFLYSQIGTTYGGDGVQTFALPDLRGRVPVHHSDTYINGQRGGSETVMLTSGQLPQHTHAVAAAGPPNSADPSGRFWADDNTGDSAPYKTNAMNTLMSPASIGTAGQSAPHENMMPFQALNYIIALEQYYEDTPFIAEVRAFAFGRMPKGWAPCSGAILSIASNTALFSLIGVTYGGDGMTNFGLPNLVGQVPVGAGSGPGLTPRALGEIGGVEQVTLNLAQLAQHSHVPNAFDATGDSQIAANHIWSRDVGGVVTYGSSVGAAMAAQAIGPAGGTAPHENRQPYLALNYGIALFGLYPPRS